MKTLLKYWTMFQYLIGIKTYIHLSPEEVKWIKLMKFHYKNTYSYKGEWTEVCKPLFEEIYGWSPNEFYRDYLDCLFLKLLDLHLKIELDYSGSRQQLKDVFNASFGRKIFYQQKLPIENAIAALCGNIQNNQVIVNGIARYKL